MTSNNNDNFPIKVTLKFNNKLFWNLVNEAIKESISVETDVSK